MKLAKLVVMCLVVLLTTSAWADVSSVGNNDDLKYSRWLPKKAYIAFNQQDGVISSYRVIFQANKRKRQWKLPLDNQILSIMLQLIGKYGC